MAYIKEPHIIKPIELIISLAEKKLGKKMLPARLLLWAPKAFVSSMILEGLISHKKGSVSERMLKLIRMRVSLLITCPFCIDMNSAGFRKHNITNEEVMAMQGLVSIRGVTTFSYKERLVLYFAVGLVRTPIKQNPRLIKAMTRGFSEKEYATIVTTIAQVDYWTRVIQGFGIKPAGFLESCDVNLFTKLSE